MLSIAESMVGQTCQNHNHRVNSMNNSWIDVELAAVFGNWMLPESEPDIESGLSAEAEAAIVAELARIERVVAERRAALTVQSAAKERAFRAIRRHRMVAGI